MSGKQALQTRKDVTSSCGNFATSQDRRQSLFWRSVVSLVSCERDRVSLIRHSGDLRNALPLADADILRSHRVDSGTERHGRQKYDVVQVLSRAKACHGRRPTVFTKRRPNWVVVALPR